MKKYRAVFIAVCTVVALSILGYILLKGAYLPILQPSGEIAKHESNLLIFAFSLMMVVVIPVFIMLFVFAWRYREDNPKKVKYTPEWSESKWLEAVWWAIPILIIITLATVAWKTSHTLDPYRPIVSDTKPINVQVVALEWKWLFIYPDLGVATVNELPVPEKTPINFKLSADAPMSAFWVPALGSQIYTMNGMSSQLHLIADHVGVFPGYNTNINGEGYSRMTFNVVSKTQKDFNQWVKIAQGSPNMMDEDALKEISKQGLMDPTEYMLMDKGLYNKIVMKYMEGMAPASDEKGKTKHDENMHSMHDMGGM